MHLLTIISFISILQATFVSFTSRLKLFPLTYFRAIGDLMKTIEGGNFEQIEKLVTPRGLQNYKCNTLLISMKVRINSKILLNVICFDLSQVRSRGG